MVDTIKFSEMASGGDIANNDVVPGLSGGVNVLFNNPWTFLPSGTTAERPAPSAIINFRLRFNTEDQLYEYYDAVQGAWTQLQESLFTQGPFITYEADASLPDAQNLGALADGILKQTILAGSATLDIAVNEIDYYGPGMMGYLEYPRGVKDSSGNILLEFSPQASAVNAVGIENSPAAENPGFLAIGSDTNIGLDYGAKGTGIHNFYSESTTPFQIENGTAYQRINIFQFLDVAGTFTYTYPEESGTLALTSQLLSESNLIYVDPDDGSDITGNGTALHPYQTITYANSVITDNSVSNPYTLILSGEFSETTITVKPWISWFAPSPVRINTGSGSVILDSTWDGTSSASVWISNVILPFPMNFVFNFGGMTGNFSTITLNNIVIDGDLVAIGRANADDTLNLLTVTCNGAVDISDMGGSSYVTSYATSFDFSSTNATDNIFWTSGEDQFYGLTAVTETSGFGCTMQATNGSHQGAITVTGANSAYQYDSTTYPNVGFTFVSSGQAFPLVKTGLNLVPFRTETGSSYVAIPSDHVININHAGLVTVNLPNGAVAGQWLRIKDKSGAAASNNITIVPPSGNIDGSSTYVIITNYGSIDLIFDGTNWGVY